MHIMIRHVVHAISESIFAQWSFVAFDSYFLLLYIMDDRFQELETRMHFVEEKLEQMIGVPSVLDAVWSRIERVQQLENCVYATDLC